MAEFLNEIQFTGVCCEVLYLVNYLVFVQTECKYNLNCCSGLNSK
jgi:hypothetical protein